MQIAINQSEVVAGTCRRSIAGVVRVAVVAAPSGLAGNGNDGECRECEIEASFDVCRVSSTDRLGMTLKESWLSTRSSMTVLNLSGAVMARAASMACSG